MTHPPFRALLVALALASFVPLACGGAANGDGHAGGSSTGGAANGGSTGGRSDSGGSHAGNASGGMSSGGMSSGGMSSGGASCAVSDFADDSGWSVAVMIANQSSQTLHLGQTTLTCGVSPLFRVEDAAGSELPALGDCRQPCESVLKSGGIGCPAVCRFPEAVTLAPGEGTNLIWTGLLRRGASVPAQCLPAGQNAEPQACDRAEQIEPGVFKFLAQAGTALDCSATIGACGPCMTASVGGCTTSAGLIAGRLVSAEITVKLDAGYGVGPGGGGGATLPVEIIFKD